MSLKTSGSYLKAFLTDPQAWKDYGGYERVVLSIAGAPASSDWEVDDLADGTSVEVISGYRLDGRGRRTGCFVITLSDWLVRHTATQVLVDLPREMCPQLQDWAQQFGARCSAPVPSPMLARE